MIIGFANNTLSAACAKSAEKSGRKMRGWKIASPTACLRLQRDSRAHTDAIVFQHMWHKNTIIYTVHPVNYQSESASRFYIKLVHHGFVFLSSTLCSHSKV